MNKVELLAPAGDFSCLKAAIEAGCDAVYIGGKLFGARAFSSNFTDDEIIKAINYAHLFGVKVYVTTNTLIYDKEVERFLEYILFLHKNNVDAVIIQDLGMLDLVRQTFPNLEVHASTQMHIHNLDGASFMEKLGVKRVVLARETSISKIKEIKEKTNIDIEIFIHGALCVSYSGQCLMSSLIGNRSGNRGTCAGSCRQSYSIVDENNNIILNNKYPLSMKDLCSLGNLKTLLDIGVTSLKIEGRMKSSSYVYTVVKLYRLAIDSYYKNNNIYIDEKELYNLKKIFNREFTKGFLFDEENNKVINMKRPNHQGVEIGKVINYKNNVATIKLNDEININDGLRIVGKKDIGVNVNNFYINSKLVKTAKKGDIITIKVNDKVEKDDKVLLTLDSKLNEEINNIISSNQRKVLVKAKFIAKEDKQITFELTDFINKVVVISENKVTKALNKPITKEEIKEKLNKIKDTVYKYESLDIEIDDNIFIPLNIINDLKRKAFEELNNKRLYKIPYKKCEYKIDVKSYPKERLLNILIDKNEDINILKKKYDYIYSIKDIDGTILKLPRVIDKYKKTYNKEVLVGDIGYFNKHKVCITDTSFNVVNSYTVAFLHSLGAERVTLSYELTKKQIEILINAYEERYKAHPNLELVVEGYEEVMISKFSLNKYFNNDKLYLKDRFNNLYKIKEKDNLMIIYNYKKRKDFNLSYYDIGINSLRINKEE
ncbi:MAG TPA: U32 family peptidase [Bacilli bacterium]|nr:U32 family peptidase [Bacilli bacterium]